MWLSFHVFSINDIAWCHTKPLPTCPPKKKNWLVPSPLRAVQKFFMGQFTLLDSDLEISIAIRKRSVLKCFPSTRKLKAPVFKFLRFQERFRKASFSWRITLDCRVNAGELLILTLDLFRERSPYAGEIRKPSLFSTVRPTVHTNPSRKRDFSKTLFKPEEFENACFSFSCRQKTFWNGAFWNDELTIIMWFPSPS